jgi:hypothetical protein
MIREIIRPEKNRLVINIPNDYIHKEVEILVFPVLKGKRGKLNKAYSEENLMEFRRLMKQARKSNIKVPKDVDIDDLIDEINNDIY